MKDGQEGTFSKPDDLTGTRIPAENPETCAGIHDFISRIGDKWTLLTVRRLGAGPMRFNALRREVEGVSQKMLAQTLRHLERDGFVTRTVTPTTPPQVEYALTDLGHRLFCPVHALAGFVIDNAEEIEAARAAYDARAAEA